MSIRQSYVPILVGLALFIAFAIALACGAGYGAYWGIFASAEFPEYPIRLSVGVPSTFLVFGLLGVIVKMMGLYREVVVEVWNA
ncbi:MAG: hypothetical protein ABII13_01180 [Patescibacteria group bacterium]